MTEEEAKAKRCPAGAGEISVVAGDIEGPRLRTYGTNCIASACMAWRPEPIRRESVTGTAAADLEASGWVRTGERVHWGVEMLRSGHGYCGLAGKP